MFYSKRNNGFYDTAIHGDAIPSDAVEISIDSYLGLMESQTKGKVIVGDDKGFPTAVTPNVSSAAKAVGLRMQRDDALAATDWIVTRHRDEMEASDVPTLQPEQYAALQTYRQALRNITSQPGFPDVTLPAAPDFIA